MNAAAHRSTTGHNATDERDTRLHGLPLRLAQAAWLLVTGTVIVLDLAGIPATYAQDQTPCTTCRTHSDSGPPSTSEAHTLHAMGISLHFWASYETAIIVVAMLIFIGMGVLLFLRRSDDRMALFASLMLVTFGGAAVTGTMQALPTTHPILWLPVNAADALGQIAFVVFFFVFPDGRFVPRWALLPVLVWSFSWIAGLLRNPWLDHAAGFINNGPLFPVIIASVIVAQVYRYGRVSTPRERKQTKWVVYGFALGVGGFLLMLFVGNVILPTSARNNPILHMFADGVIIALFMFIPVAIAIAILRSGLYDIDVLINRTLVYGSLTVLLAAVYFASVVGMQRLATAVAGSQASANSLIIVLSTLLIAALFTPLRRRIQRFIDRRFYRATYDAAKTLERFAASLRSEVDLAELGDRLVGVVDDTMRPAYVSLWLRAPTAARPAPANEEPPSTLVHEGGPA